MKYKATQAKIFFSFYTQQNRFFSSTVILCHFEKEKKIILASSWPTWTPPKKVTNFKGQLWQGTLTEFFFDKFSVENRFFLVLLRPKLLESAKYLWFLESKSKCTAEFRIHFCTPSVKSMTFSWNKSGFVQSTSSNPLYHQQREPAFAAPKSTFISFIGNLFATLLFGHDSNTRTEFSERKKLTRRLRVWSFL